MPKLDQLFSEIYKIQNSLYILFSKNKKLKYLILFILFSFNQDIIILKYYFLVLN